MELVTNYQEYLSVNKEYISLVRELIDAVAEEQLAEDTAIKIKKEFGTIKEELEEKMPETPEKKPSEIIVDRFTQLQAILKGASYLAQISGERTLLEMRLAEVNELIADIALGGDEAEADSTEASEQNSEHRRTKARVKLALAGLPNLTDSFSELGRIMDRPPLTALTMVKHELNARLQATTAAQAHTQARIDFVKEKHASLDQELSGYNDMFRLINNARNYGRKAGIGDTLSYSYRGLMRKKAPQGAEFELARTKQAIKAAVVLQAHVQAQSLKKRFQAEYKLIALDYQADMEESKARVAQWYALLDPMLTQQQLYHESGIRKELVASLAVELLKVLALFAIAW